VRDRGGSRLFDAIQTERIGELQWRAGLVWTGLSAGQDFAVAVEKRDVAFLSAWKLEELVGRSGIAEQGSWGILPQTGPRRVSRAKPVPCEKHHGQDGLATLGEHAGVGSVDAEIGGMRLGVRVKEAAESPSRRTCGRQVHVRAKEDGDGWRVHVTVKRGNE